MTYTEQLESILHTVLHYLENFADTSSSEVSTLTLEIKATLFGEALIQTPPCHFVPFSEGEPPESALTGSGKCWVYRPLYPPLQPGCILLKDPKTRTVNELYWASAYSIPIILARSNPCFPHGSQRN